MFYKAGGLALILSAGIALMVTLLILPFGGLTAQALIAVFSVTLVVGFIVLYYTLEYFFFREMKTLDGLIDKLGRKGSSDNINPLRKIAGDLMAFSEEKKREIDTLKKLEAFRKDFIADVSHELKTPIFAAQGFVHTLLDGAVKEKAVRKKFLRKAAKSLDRLDILVQDLLTLSHIETGQIKMRLEEIDLYALTKEVFDQFRGKTNKKEVSLRIEGPIRKVMVYADWQRISQVMTNLISNAIKHSEENGEVEVIFSDRKKSVITQVRDFGEGIAPDHIHRIFERFYRVDKSRSREKGGTGLGLAIVKHILEGHHTFAGVESIPGKGSTFSFKLPKGKHENTEHGEHHEPANTQNTEDER